MTAPGRGAPAAPAPNDRAWIVRGALVVAATAVAYHESLRTLTDWLRLDSPLAHLSLVPLLALGIAVLRGSAPDAGGVDDRRLDWIVGVAFVGTAYLVNLVLPARDSASYWQWRIDLLSMPVFVAGVVALLFGVRALWRRRAAICFLFLAWPWPYYQLVDHSLGAFTRSTVRSVAFVTTRVEVADLVSVDAGRFRVGPEADSFTVLVASSCSGANGVIGYGLVAGALALVSGGTRRAKALWFLTGAALVWAVNVARIVLLLGVANRWGRDAAMDGFHPYAGIVGFVAVIAVLVALAPRFRVRLFGHGSRLPPPPIEPGAGPARRPQVFAALVVLAVATSQISGLNAELRTSDLVAYTLGPPRSAAFAQTREAPTGWSVRELREIDWAAEYFGAGARWRRYAYTQTELGAALGAPGLSIFADVVSTGDRRALATYGIESCYSFHEYAVRGRHSVDLGAGVTAVVLSWTESGTGVEWTSVYWHWPVRAGGATSYERISLIARAAADVAAVPDVSPPRLARSMQLAAADELRGATAVDDPAIVPLQAFLTAFARSLVAERSAVS